MDKRKNSYKLLILFASSRFCVFAFIFCFLILTACSRNPVTGKKEIHFISESTEINLGESHYALMQQAQGGTYTAEKSIQEYVEKVGEKLAAVSDRPNLPFEFVVLNNSVPNAWALPGGKIAIYRGLLLELNSEAELAAVLSHEIVHSAARHSAQAMERSVLMSAGLIGLSQILKGKKYEDVALAGAAVGATLGTLKFSRNAELEADKYGIKYMVAAGYDPQAAVELQKLFLKLSKGGRASWFSALFSTHPPSEERIQANEKTVAGYPSGGFMGVTEYQIAMAPLKNSVDAYKDLDQGYQALMNGNVTSAISYADKGIAIEPGEPQLYNLKGKALAKDRNFEEALVNFTKAVQLDGNYFDFYLQKGLAEQKLGQIQAAKQDLEKSTALLPSQEAENALGQIEMKLGNGAAAQKHFQIASQAGSAKQEINYDKFIKIRTSQNSRGEIYLNIDNLSNIPIRNIEILLTFVDSKHAVIDKQRVFISQKISGGSSMTVPIKNKTPPRTAKIYSQVLGAEPTN